MALCMLPRNCLTLNIWTENTPQLAWRQARLARFCFGTTRSASAMISKRSSIYLWIQMRRHRRYFKLEGTSMSKSIVGSPARRSWISSTPSVLWNSAPRKSKNSFRLNGSSQQEIIFSRSGSCMADEQKVIIWGAAGHALVVADIMRLVSYEVVGFIDDLNSERHKAEFCGSVILGGREQLESLRKQNLDQLIFGFGDCQARLKLSDIARQKGFRLARAIHPRSVVAMDVMVGDGTVIAAGAVVNPASSIGENV